MTISPEIEAMMAAHSDLFIDTKQEIANYITTAKYSRFLEDQQRRETWDEAVNRVQMMHLDRFDFLSSKDMLEIIKAFDLVRQKKVAPSMRSMQFGGKAIEQKNERIYNCAVRHVDSIRSFAELFYLLLCGCGTGVGLFQKYLDRLPNLVSERDKTGTVMVYVVEDTVEGWADSVEALLSCYFVNTAFSGRKIVFDFSKIRPEGALLKTSGGRAPGYKGLKAALGKIKELLDDIIENKQQDRMLSIDAYDVIMHMADAVLSGGVRRSATSIMFSKDDDLMMHAKTGNWWETHPHRKRSNNSVLLQRGEVTYEEFAHIVQTTKEWGEPGFVFADTEDVLYNPCFEVSFVPVTEDGVCGVQMCNLTTINGGKVNSLEDFVTFSKAAALIGTLQAAYTDFPYLSNAAEKLTRDEALLGVSITAMMESPDIILNPEYQRIAAAAVVETNKEWAEKLDINPAARCTVIKPEGTSTLALKSMFSGIHPAHAKFMFRRVQANRTEPVFQHLRNTNPHAVEASVNSTGGTDDVITFPIYNPDGLVKSDLTAIEHLDIIKSTQENWVVPGTSEVNTKPVNHNVSCTVIVDDDEWSNVTEYLYHYRNSFAAVSLLAKTGDKDYAQAPMEAVTTAEDLERFIDLMKNWTPVDYTQLREEQDNTAATAEAACVGGACEIITT